jgi:hypothetical protein
MPPRRHRALLVVLASFLAIASATPASAQDQAAMALVRKLYEAVWNNNDMATAKSIIHDEFMSAENITFPAVRGLPRLEAEMNFYRKTYPGLKFEVVRMLSAGDTIVTMWRATGGSGEEFIDRAGKTRKKELQAEGVGLSRVVGGRIIETTLYWPRNPLFP